MTDVYLEMTDVPAGIWYEATRKRWRVRVYSHGEVVWLSYHKTLSDALEALRNARDEQRAWYVKKDITPPKTVLDLWNK